MSGGKGCIRQADDGRLWFMNHIETGWGSFGYQARDWNELVRRFNVRIGPPERDGFGLYWPAWLDVEGPIQVDPKQVERDAELSCAFAAGLREGRRDAARARQTRKGNG